MSEKDSLISDKKIECNIPYDTASTCEEKVLHLRECQKLHKMTSIAYRKSLLKKLLEIWDKYEKEIHISNYLDLGQNEFISKFTSFYQVRNEILYSIKNIDNWVKPKKCDSSLLFALSTNYVQPEPFGISLIFSAWNCNFLTLIIPIVQSIAAGNLICAKPAATAPETQKVCMKILNEMPKDVVQCCAGPSEVREKLLSMKFDLIIFTGSAKIGKIIAQAAAPFLTPTILELGGQNPVIVDKSANLKTAAYNITFGRHQINGQACISPEYVMVENCIFDKFLEMLKKCYFDFYGENTKISDGLGKMVNKKYAQRLYDLIKNPGKGAKLEYGGIEKCDVENRFITPTVFSFQDIKTMGESNLAKEELFGPVLYVAPYQSLNEAVDYMNSREKPLSSYFFSNDSKNKKFVKENTSAGVLIYNDTVIHFAQSYVPFGGVGNSGMGHYHGKFGFDNMSHLKPIVDQTNLIMSPRYPPYNDTKKKILEFVLRYLPYGRDEVLKKIAIVICVIVMAVLIIKYLKK